jgi:signal transduction histidine kinase
MAAVSQVRKLTQTGRLILFAFSTLSLIAIHLTYEWMDERMLSELDDLSLLIGLVIQFIFGLLIAQGNWKVASASTSQPLRTRQLLKQNLVNAHDLNEISKVLLRLAHTFVPLVGASFIRYDQKSGSYERIDEWSVDGRPLPIPAPIPSQHHTSVDFSQKEPALGYFIPGKCSKNGKDAEILSIFCMPRLYGDSQTTLLSLFFPPDASFSYSQFSLLNEIALEAELAIERAHLRRLLSSLDSANKIEQDKIARYLHDTLGHNLAFLRLKLDQLSGDGALQDIVLIQQEIERMRDIADLAYEQMRNSLSDLRGEPVPEFAAAIQEYAVTAGNRAGFDVLLQIDGTSRPLPTLLQRQILYVLREVLRNIEKHARASKVWIRLSWEAEDLVIHIEDDGCGFDVGAARNQPGHFGLQIIEQCIQEFHGHFMLRSEVNAGTKVELCFPIDQYNYSFAGNP